MLSRSWVPRTMLSSQKRIFFPRSMSELWMSFIFATRSLAAWNEGMNDLDHVGVYFATVLMYGTPWPAA